MSLLTADRYRAITGDDASAEDDVEAALADAVEQLEDVLGRPLEEAERTESVIPARDGKLWPKAVPLVDVGDYEADGFAVLGGVSGLYLWGELASPSTPVSLVYTGGWVERTDNPDAANRLPTYIERDLAFAVHRLLHLQPVAVGSQIPAGAMQVQLGDAAVTFGQGGYRGGSRDPLAGCWSAATLQWKHAA